MNTLIFLFGAITGAIIGCLVAALAAAAGSEVPRQSVTIRLYGHGGRYRIIRLAPGSQTAIRGEIVNESFGGSDHRI